MGGGGREGAGGYPDDGRFTDRAESDESSRDDPRPSYCELHCHSNFTFLDGAAHPETLARRAAELGYPALAITDRDGLYGAVRHCLAARAAGIKPVFGSEITLDDGSHLTLLARTDAGYSNLTRLLTRAKEGRPKGEAAATFEEVGAHAGGLVVLSGCAAGRLPRAIAAGDLSAARAEAGRLRDAFGADGFYVEVQRHFVPSEDALAATLLAFARAEGIRAVATNDARYVDEEGRRLQDVLTSVRLHTTLGEAGSLLRPNGEYRLKSAEEMRALFPRNPDLLEATVEIASRCSVSLAHLPYRLPSYAVPEGETEFSYLHALVWEGARARYRPMTPAAMRQLTHELSLVEELGLAGYFLVVWDIVRFCREENILCQGRGSAANSAVCYALGITAVDPVGMELLFERFLSEGRSEPPDIDIDIAHRDRERVIQYVYRNYGRERAAMVSEVITYGARSAVRDVGKALGLTVEQVDAISKSLDRWGGAEEGAIETAAAAAGLDGGGRESRTLGAVCRALDGFPRHMSIHVGGMVISHGPIAEVVPVEPAAMPGRTVIAWDKDDAGAVGLVKIDLLGLGMLTLIAEGVRLVREEHGTEIDLARLGYDDPEVYDMLCRADTVGIFQVESRAQMNTLPRMRPRCFYDLVVEVALIRPGPIQGGMVHPYLRRRAGREEVTYPHPSLETILARTLGVPLFQEQLMKVAVTAAGFTPSEADGLRRAMGKKRSRRAMDALLGRLREGMRANGYGDAVIESIVSQITGFADYGFPEAHAASFATLVYASAYLKRYYPAEFYCALYNAQPMGFYSPATIAGDARRRGVRILPPDVNRSGWDGRIEKGAVRLGLRVVRGIGEAERPALERAVAEPFSTPESFCETALAAGLSRAALEALAAAGALGIEPREGLWVTLGRTRGGAGPLGTGEESPEPQPALAPMSEADAIAQELQTTGVMLGRHVIELVRGRLERRGVLRVSDLSGVRAGDVVEVGGLVICRQRPPTARGMLFLTLEDETGLVNVAAAPNTFDRLRRELGRAPALVVRGKVEREAGAISLLVLGACELTVGGVLVRSRDYR
jgi:error-prone DNA polymerase